MICLQPSWLSTHPSRRFSADQFRSQSLGSLEHLKLTETDLRRTLPQATDDQTTDFDTTKVYHLLHLRKSCMLRSSRKNKVLKTFGNTCTRSTTDISRKVKPFEEFCSTKTVNDINNFFSNSSAKQQKIKKVIQWIQKNSQKASDKYKLLKSSYFVKKQEAVKSTQGKSLQEVLKEKETARAFREFLIQEMSVENLDFWFEVENFKLQKPSKQEKMADSIFQTFIAPGAPKEVNLDSSIRKDTKEKLISPDPTSFDVAQTQIFKLMENDSFRRFTKLSC